MNNCKEEAASHESSRAKWVEGGHKQTKEQPYRAGHTFTDTDTHDSLYTLPLLYNKPKKERGGTYRVGHVCRLSACVVFDINCTMSP